MSEPPPPGPELPGYRYLRPVEGGSGGYAQVYVYEQDSPRREVAVKVLKSRRIGGAEVRDILDEANAMARLGNHPNIVTVLAARTAKDGRPCIIMMYCSGPNLMQLVAGGQLDVRRVVRLGIQIADVLQFAHQVHIIHRDIKPANILTDELGNPRLTDFGIAGRIVPGEDADDRQFGVSLPWCPPELLRGEPGSVASDIYSLGATLWHLLAGRSPVDVPGHNTSEEIEHRILHVPAPRTGRPDVPGSLERLLARMLAKRPEERPASAAQVMAELTQIEGQLGGPPPSGASWYATNPPTAAVSTGATATVVPPAVPTSRMAPPPSAGPSPAGPSAVGPAAPAASLSDDAGKTTVRDRRSRPPVVAPAGGRMASTDLRAYERTTLRGTSTGEPPVPPEPDPEPPARSARWSWAVALAVVLAAVGALVVWQPWAATQPPPTHAQTSPEEPDPNAGLPYENLPPGRPTVHAERVDAQTVRYTWEYSNRLESDSYVWQTNTGQEGTVEEPTVDLPVPAGVRVCVQVRVYRQDGSFASPNWSDPGCGGNE